jgi:hypothetical protein
MLAQGLTLVSSVSSIHAPQAEPGRAQASAISPSVVTSAGGAITSKLPEYMERDVVVDAVRVYLSNPLALCYAWENGFVLRGENGDI